MCQDVCHSVQVDEVRRSKSSVLVLILLLGNIGAPALPHHSQVASSVKKIQLAKERGSGAAVTLRKVRPAAF